MSNVLLEMKDHVAVITINRPKALNALSTEVLSDLNSALAEVCQTKSIYALIITGAGEKSFVAGADIAEMKDKNTDEAATYGRFGNQIFSRIENFRCPVIAAVNGFALGGGCELAMACDIRIASSNARFAQPETGLGITPGFGGTQRLPRLVGAGIAKELIYSCRQIKADEALAIGLVNKVVEPENLMEEAMKLANRIATNAPIAVANAKKAINDGLQTNMDAGVSIEVKEFSACFATEDQKLAMNAFVNKEKVEQFHNK
ncbi:short-chain-enoyl-CoA hydratase [Massilicoli timonensis]|uniref:short-chain-enoyl-CoA hydratase n=1 Tax=Massilicoli timonensis TaxID=2015901 RepID=UPI0023EF6181|nr:short-chain-enoyl-CoA hydratase [Massilicoli timonensis]